MAAPADVDLAVLLSAAAVAVLQHHPPLAEHAVALGYVDKLVKLLAARWVVLFFEIAELELLSICCLELFGRWGMWTSYSSYRRPGGWAHI